MINNITVPLWSYMLTICSFTVWMLKTNIELAELRERIWKLQFRKDYKEIFGNHYSENPEKEN